MSTEVALIAGSATNGDSSQEGVIPCRREIMSAKVGLEYLQQLPAATSPRMITSDPATETFHVAREVWRACTTLPDASMTGWASAPRKCYVARIARPAPRLTARGLFGPCDLARRLPTAASIGQIPVPPCCLGVLLALVLPAVCLFSPILPCRFPRIVFEGSPSLLVVLIFLQVVHPHVTTGGPFALRSVPSLKGGTELKAVFLKGYWQRVQPEGLDRNQSQFRHQTFFGP